jgi:hypothetical protein
MSAPVWGTPRPEERFATGDATPDSYRVHQVSAAFRVTVTPKAGP